MYAGTKSTHGSAAAGRFQRPFGRRLRPTADLFDRVLFDQRFWPGIADGSITLAFRRWKRPTVRAGGRLRSPLGELAIEGVDVIDGAEITESDASRAGFESRDALLRELDTRAGTLYRIAFHLRARTPGSHSGSRQT